MDDVTVKVDTPLEKRPHAVYSISECLASVNFRNKVRREYFGALDSGGSAPSEKKPKVVTCLQSTDWQDGFGPSKVKNNRTNIDFRSVTISPPKTSVNGTQNSFIIALGLKQSEGWEEVGRLFHKELNQLRSMKEPLYLYNGVLEKVVPCFLDRIAFLSDKQERNSLTGTMACTSHQTEMLWGGGQTGGCPL